MKPQNYKFSKSRKFRKKVSGLKRVSPLAIRTPSCQSDKLKLGGISFFKLLYRIRI